MIEDLAEGRGGSETSGLLSVEAIKDLIEGVGKSGIEIDPTRSSAFEVRIVVGDEEEGDDVDEETNDGDSVGSQPVRKEVHKTTVDGAHKVIERGVDTSVILVVVQVLEIILGEERKRSKIVLLRFFNCHEIERSIGMKVMDPWNIGVEEDIQHESGRIRKVFSEIKIKKKRKESKAIHSMTSTSLK